VDCFWVLQSGSLPLIPTALPLAAAITTSGCGRSSVVEHNLAKVGVESSNLFARSRRTLEIAD
jgi:hypothetical protein